MGSLIDMCSKLEADDILHKASFVVYESVAECIKGDFSAFSDYIFPIVAKAAVKKVDFKVVDETETAET